jgi:tyrosyl-tRNA synthetase
MRISTNPDLIEELLSRSIDTIYPSTDALRQRLLEGRQLQVYMGIDPTADYIHIGHSTNYIILRRLHDLGHKITVLVGDFTAMIGDPSDKSSMRIQLTKQEVQKNLASFKSQISKILSFDSVDNPIEFRFNSEWLSKLTFVDATELAANFTVQQMIDRDAFQKRLQANKPLFVHEFFYPLMQGYDSVALDADLEIGGTDQTFNMLAGRTLVKRYKGKEKLVMTTTLLTNPVTGEKLMSKSLGTGVSIKAESKDMFGKVMALPDEGVIQCFIDCTYLSMDEISTIKRELENGTNPRDIKMRLAHELVAMYHTDEKAHNAQRAWIEQFTNGNLPENISSLAISGATSWPDLLLNGGFAATKSDARRLIKQGAVKIQHNKINLETPFTPAHGDILQVGKRGIARIETI